MQGVSVCVCVCSTRCVSAGRVAAGRVAAEFVVTAPDVHFSGRVTLTLFTLSRGQDRA